MSMIVNRLRDQTPDAVHYVVFDACREELRLTRDGTKALERKGFVPVANISGLMIAYATAPGKTASDVGDGGGVYAKTLGEEIVKPGVESVMMFRTVPLKVKQVIGQDPLAVVSNASGRLLRPVHSAIGFADPRHGRNLRPL